MAEPIEEMNYHQDYLLTEKLNKFKTRVIFFDKHQWRCNKVVVWDNRHIVYRAMSCNTKAERRVMRRLAVLGRPTK